MLLAVAGAGEEEVDQRTTLITSGRWDSFTPAERLGFDFARKLTAESDKVNQLDQEGLVATFGPNRAVDIIWYISWCNYMTRVADAFQLPLETQNVFQQPKPAGERE